MYNHVNDIGGMAVDVGFSFPAAYASIIKEAILQINETLSASRYLKNVNTAGGIKSVSAGAWRSWPCWSFTCTCSATLLARADLRPKTYGLSFTSARLIKTRCGSGKANCGWTAGSIATSLRRCSSGLSGCPCHSAIQSWAYSTGARIRSSSVCCASGTLLWQKAYSARPKPGQDHPSLANQRHRCRAGLKPGG